MTTENNSASESEEEWIIIEEYVEQVDDGRFYGGMCGTRNCSLVGGVDNGRTSDAVDGAIGGVDGVIKDLD